MEIMGYKKTIVITSIFEPTLAIKKFAEIKGSKLIVIGDIKTPSDWNYKNVDYVSVNDQNNMNYTIIPLLPYNHYCRKMIGYLKAIENGAKFIVDTDDDNIPKDGWAFPNFEEENDTITGISGYINIYQLFTEQKIWPRGLPLKMISKNFDLSSFITKKKLTVGIWQGLADEDPDVDAIYRLTNDEACYFFDREPVVLTAGVISPFNTQNTMIRKELFCLLYLPTYVTFRFTDILRGLVAQPIMWLHGYHLGFTQATVLQKRNPHDYMKDFLSEIPMYEHGESVIEIVSNSISSSDTIESNLLKAYNALFKNNIVCEKELITLEAWIYDLNKN